MFTQDLGAFALFMYSCGFVALCIPVRGYTGVVEEYVTCDAHGGYPTQWGHRGITAVAPHLGQDRHIPT